MEEEVRETALLCAECGWILAGLTPPQAAEVPRCLACGAAPLLHEPVRKGVRIVRWPTNTPGWAVYSRAALDRRLVMSESRN